MNFDNIPAGKDLPNDIYVAIEIPANHAPIKYEIDKDMKLEPEIFNYVDHPYFSILIRVQEISN